MKYWHLWPAFKNRFEISIMNTNISLIQVKLHIIVDRANYVDLYALQENAPYFLDFATREAL